MRQRDIGTDPQQLEIVDCLLVELLYGHLEHFGRVTRHDLWRLPKNIGDSNANRLPCRAVLVGIRKDSQQWALCIHQDQESYVQ